MWIYMLLPLPDPRKEYVIPPELLSEWAGMNEQKNEWINYCMNVFKKNLSTCSAPKNLSLQNMDVFYYGYLYTTPHKDVALNWSFLQNMNFANKIAN